MVSDSQVAGVSDLLKMLDQLPEKIKMNAVRGAVRASSRLFQLAAKNGAPQEIDAGPKAPSFVSHTGALKASIRVSVRVSGDYVNGRIIAGNKKAFYARWVEFGTAAHYIRPANAKSLFLAGLMREDVHHPGARKHPFMRPAFDTTTEAAISTFAAYVQRRIDKEMLKDDSDAS